MEEQTQQTFTSKEARLTPEYWLQKLSFANVTEQCNIAATSNICTQHILFPKKEEIHFYTLGGLVSTILDSQ